MAIPDSGQMGGHARPGTALTAALREALGKGEPERVAEVIRAGADVRYQREKGYDALLDAVHGRDIRRDPRLLELLSLLVAHGVELSGVSAYGESALRVLSRVGRFDAVRLLLGAGADKDQLGFTPLMESVALGSLEDVRAALAQGPPLEEWDWWSRTAYLIALVTGDLAKIKLLRERGADPAARGRCDQPPLFYAIQGGHPHVLRWLIGEGEDVGQTDDSGETALIEAVGAGDVECVEILLAAGVDVEVNVYGTALSRAESRPIILRLLEAGANPADLSSEAQRALVGLAGVGTEVLDAITPEEFRRTFRRAFGNSNPERVRVPFWEAMVRCGASAYEASRRFEQHTGPLDGPVWCAQRFGQSLTLLPDGSAVRIAGEHEDHYDPDFCIYNDVFVHGADGSLAIYGYPEAVFPATDFHTATLVGDFIYVIGSLGYRGRRRYGQTQVYRLELGTLRMEAVDTRGEAPGWVYEHRAAMAGAREIQVWGGKVLTASGGKESHGPNADTFVLDLDRRVWRRER